jgi:hypothetical protein
MERETKEIKVQNRTFKVKTYATAREVNQIQQALLKGTKVSVVGDQPKIDEFNPSAQFDMECELIKTMVVSMDGSEEFMPALESSPAELWNALVAELDALVSKKKS